MDWMPPSDTLRFFGILPIDLRFFLLDFCSGPLEEVSAGMLSSFVDVARRCSGRSASCVVCLGEFVGRGLDS